MKTLTEFCVSVLEQGSQYRSMAAGFIGAVAADRQISDV